VGRDTVPGGGATDRRDWPVSECGRGCADARGPAREETGTGRPDAQ
jgi:hypothetical protein